MWQTDVPAAMKYIGEALELSRSVGDKAALIFNLRQMGNMLVQTDPHEARKYHEESVQLARQVGDKYAEAHGLNSLAIAFQLGGNPEKAMVTFAQSLEINRAVGNRLNEAMVLGNMAGLYSAEGDLETAERTAKESIAISKEIGAITLLPNGQSTLAEVCLRGGRNAEAREWIRTTGDTLRSIGVPPTLLTILYGILKVREGDRPTGLAWIGFGRAHDPNKQEMAGLISSFGKLLRGDASEDEVEAAMRAGEGLKLEEILAEAEAT
jgi:tetratricopeptide (TPR) repeat protein